MIKIFKHLLKSEWSPIVIFSFFLIASLFAPVLLGYLESDQPEEFVFQDPKSIEPPKITPGVDYDYEIYNLIPGDLDPLERAEIACAIYRAERVFKIGRKTLISIIQVESGFDKWAVGGSGEIGLMQIKPKTADWVSTKYGIHVPPEGLRDPFYNIMCGSAYLRFLVDEFRNKGHEKDSLWIMVIAAYNRGYWSRELFKPVSEVGRLRYVQKVLLAFHGVCDERS